MILIDSARLTQDDCRVGHLPSFCQRCFGDGLEWQERDPIFGGQLAYIATCLWCGLVQQYSAVNPVLPPGRHPED